MKIAEIGNIVQWECSKAGTTLKGKVLKINENSVMVDLTINENWKQLGLEERTIVGHSRYALLEVSEKASPVERVKTYEIVPGSLENYNLLREAGHTDTKIRKMWDDTDKEVKWHGSRFHTWKQEHGLVNSYKQDVPKKVAEVAVEEKQPMIVSDEPKTELDMLQEAWPDHPIFETTAEREEPKTLEETHMVQFGELKAQIETLMKELEYTKGQLWSERTARLFEMQAHLDALICESNGIQIAEHNSEHILATIVELAEVAQEEQSFKYWKKNKEIDRAKLLEELSDVMHFIISRGVQNGIRRISSVENVVETKCDSVTEQMLYITEMLLIHRQNETTKGQYTSLFKAFIDLSEMFGFTWEELSDEYVRKNNVNLARQNQNY